MRKISRMMMLGAMAATMWSCSSDNAPDSSDKNDPVATGDSYLAVNIQLPTRSATTRANDNFDDGKENEYDVKNGVLLLFTGANEADAVFHGAYNIWPMDGVQGSDQITTTYKKVLKVTKFTVNTNVYGLVMLNYSDAIYSSTATTEGEATVTTHKVGDKSLTAGSTKFSEMQKAVKDGATYSSNPFYSAKNGFFMTNTVLSSKVGGSADPSGDGTLSTLANLGTKLYNTEPEALEGAQSIFVERALAKVTMSVPGTLKLKLKENGTGENAGKLVEKELTVTGSTFALGNLELSSYVVRNMASTYLPYFSSIKGTDELQKYRFVGPGKLGESSLQPYVPFYRTYWCEDPTYGGKKYSDDITAFSEGYGNDYPLYCYENTFPVAAQDTHNTTRAVIKVVMNGGQNFFIINDNKDVFYSEEDAKSYITNYLARDGKLKSEIEEGYKAAYAADHDGAQVPAGTTVTYTDYFDVNYSAEVDEEGVLAVATVTPKGLKKKVTSTNAEGEEEISYTDLTQFACATVEGIGNIVTEVNNFAKLTRYSDGVVYYSVLIKHFGNDLTPWEHADDETFDATTTALAYGSDPTASQNYLGRYGLVRNNWYDINVSSIKKLGSPVVPPIGEVKPDDYNEVEQYIAFFVNVMSWAKRTHNYDLE